MNKKERFTRETLALISRNGFEGTTMRDIATNLGCDVANVYNYITSKSALLEEHLFSISAEFHQGIGQIIDSQIPLMDKLHHIIALYVRLSFNKPYQVSLLVNDWRSLSEDKKTEFLLEKASFEEKVRSIISQGVVQGLFRIKDVEVLLSVFLSNLRWLFEHNIHQDKRANPVELEHSLKLLILHGMLATHPEN